MAENNIKSFVVKGHGLCVRVADFVAKAAKVFDVEIMIKFNRYTSKVLNAFNGLLVCAVKGMKITATANGREVDKVNAVRRIFSGYLDDERTILGNQPVMC